MKATDLPISPDGDLAEPRGKRAAGEPRAVGALRATHEGAKSCPAIARSTTDAGAGKAWLMESLIQLSEFLGGTHAT